MSNGRDAVAMVQRMNPDVLVMDLSMQPMDGAEATKQLAAAGVSTRILILTMHSPDEALIPLLEAGASGFLEKSAADRELVDAVRAVAHGDTYIQTSAARVLAGGIRKRGEHSDERGKPGNARDLQCRFNCRFLASPEGPEPDAHRRLRFVRFSAPLLAATRPLPRTTPRACAPRGPGRRDRTRGRPPARVPRRRR